MSPPHQEHNGEGHNQFFFFFTVTNGALKLNKKDKQEGAASGYGIFSVLINKETHITMVSYSMNTCYSVSMSHYAQNRLMGYPILLPQKPASRDGAARQLSESIQQDLPRARTRGRETFGTWKRGWGFCLQG